MAKAYITASKRIGSVGGETYSVVKGQTIVRAKPVSVANPRTKAQVLQRAVFMDAVKFFKHSNQNFFKFAFEDKKPTESDYNAFMRHNSGDGIMITKSMGKQAGAAFIGQFLVSQGSLPAPTINYESVSSPLFITRSANRTAAITTFGALSSEFKTYYGLTDGDIVTLLFIKSNVAEIEYGPTEAECKYLFLNNVPSEPVWSIVQFVVDELDDTLLSTKGISAHANSSNLVVSGWDCEETAAAATMIFSRKSADGLKVSTSNLINNDMANEIIEMNSLEGTREKIYAAWKSAEDAILEGSEV